MGSISNITSFGDEAIWEGLVQVMILMMGILAGNIIRRKLSLVKKSLIPSALLGGVIILLLKLIPFFKMLINQPIMETVTYHCLAIGFIALALKTTTKKKDHPFRDVIVTGIVEGSSYIIQAMFGLVFTVILALATGFFPGAGTLLAMGFGQGTGQALNYGKLYETDYGFEGGTTFGLTIATMGFFVACIVGVVYMNILRRKGKLHISTDEEKNTETLATYIGENEIPNTESVDKLTVNLCLIFFIYGLVYLIMRAVNVNLVWGFNFLLGTLVTLLVRVLINLLKKGKVLHLEPTNNFLLDRIAGTAFDVMIIAGVSAINLQELSDMWLQILGICTIGAVVTFTYLRIVTRKMYPGYTEEAFFSIFGTMTGTASNGVILLREIDPAFETPAANNLVLAGIPTIVIAGGLLVICSYAPKGLKEAAISIGITLVAFIILNIVLFVIHKKTVNSTY